MTCRTSIHCDHSETCIKTSCPGHPSQPWNQFGAGRPVEPKPQPEQREETFTATEHAARVLLWIVGALALAAVLYPLTPSFN